MTQTIDRSISADEIQRFITGKRIAGCAVCSHYDWRVRDDARSLSCQCSSENGPATSLGIIMLICQNCGALEFHDRTVIARWLDCHSVK